MKITGKITELQQQLMNTNFAPKGFVPTMGALHEGHISLVRRAVAECQIVVVSIFVNPTQFNDKTDLEKYPRNPERDIAILSEVLRDDDLVFTPGVEEIYPAEDKRRFSFGNLDKVMEATHRPGHFNGVAQVVSRLFEIVNPDVAYFGSKDFQQVAVIRELVKQMKSNVKIVSCPVIRESDGLAMSSRNVLLDPDIRKKAPVIYKTLSQASEMFNEKDIPEIRDYVINTINKVPGFGVEYFEIADDAELFTIYYRKDMIPGRKYFGCIAVKAGNIRLIDNVELGTS